MAWAATAVIGSAVIGGVMGNKSAGIQADSANRASDLQAQAASEATALQKEMWQRQLADQAPWQAAGANALGKMQGYAAPSQFKFGANEFNAGQDPGYAFRLKEGMKALEGTAAARGGLLSGNAMRAAVSYGQEMGSQEYQNAFSRAVTGYNANRSSEDAGYNRLAGLAGVGQTSTQQIGAAGQNFANAAGNNMMTSGANAGNAVMAAGNARASSYQGWGNALGTGLQGLSKINWGGPQANAVQLTDGSYFGV